MACPRPKQPSESRSTNDSHNESSSFSRVNPWQHDSPSLKSVRGGLILAQQLKLQPMVDGARVAGTLAELPFMKQIVAQRDISSKSKSLLETRNTTARLTQEKEMSIAICLEVVEKQINMITQICTDLDSILKNKDKLVFRLQKPLLQDHIRMDAAYHKHMKEVFIQLVPSLNEVTKHLDNIQWASNADFSADAMNPLLVEIKSLTASLQTSFQTLHQMGHGINVLCPTGRAES